MLIKIVIFSICFSIIQVSCELVNTVEPIHYQLWLEIDDAVTKNINGKVDIDLKVNEVVDFIEFNKKELDIRSVALKLDDEVIPLDGFRDIPGAEVYHIIPRNALQPGTYALHLEWIGKIQQNGTEGLFQVNYEIPTSVTTIRRTAFLTNFKATHARSVLPCFDHPRYKATFGLTLKYRRHFGALSVMRWSSHDTEGDWAIRGFGVTPPMPIHFFGFAIYHPERGTGLQKITIDNRINIHASSNLFNQTLALLPFINQTLSAYHSYFGSRFQPDEFDILAVPFAMDFVIENWGLVVANQDLVIQAPLISHPKSFQRALQLISNQLGLNWFEGAVTVEDWRYIWLTRGLNKLLEYYVPSTHLILGEVIRSDHFSVGIVQTAFGIDETPGVQPMEKEVTLPGEINARFDDVIDVKSAAVLNTIRHAVSKEAFDDTLKQLIKEKNGSLISSTDFFNAFSLEVLEQLPAPMETIFDSWTKQIGYPVLRVSRTDNQLTQEITNPSNTPFHVPINYALSTNLDFSNTLPDFWLETAKNTIPIGSNEFAIFNKQQSGYYRVYYDPESLALISEHLKTKHSTIHPVNRAQLIDDLAYFAQRDQKEYSDLFELLNFIEVEDHYLPWLVINRRLNEIYLRLRGSETYGRFETYLREKTEDEFNRWGIGGIAIRHRTRLMKEAVADLACNAGNSRCVDETLAVVDKMLAGQAPDDVIYPEIIPILACTAFKYDFNLLGRIMGMIRLPSTTVVLQPVKNGKINNGTYGIFDDVETDIDPFSYESDLEYLAKLFGISPDMMEQISKSIGCSQNEGSLQSILDLSIVPNSQLRFGREIRRKLFTVVVQGSYEGTRLGLKFMSINYLAMNQRYDNMGLVFMAFKNQIYTDELSLLFNEVLERHGFRFYPDYVKAAADEVKSEIITNLEWARGNIPEIEEWLEANNFEPTEKPTAPIEDDEGGSTIYILIIAGSVILIAVVTIGIVVLVRLRKRRSS